MAKGRRKLVGFDDRFVNKVRSDRRANTLLGVLCLLVLSLYIFSGLWGLYNVALIDKNSVNITKDFSILEVKSVKDGVINLSDGSTIDVDDVDSSGLLINGYGNWYSQDYNCYLSEVNLDDMLNIYGSFFLVSVGLTFFYALWCRVNNKYRKMNIGVGVVFGLWFLLNLYYFIMIL